MRRDAAQPGRFSPEELLAHADWARGLAAHLVRGDADADDLVQDAMAAAIRRPPLADRPVRPWLAAVLRKLALARRRGDGRRVRRETAVGVEAAAGHVPPAADVVARLDAHRVLAETVAALPEPLRETVYLRYYEGLDSTEIGRRQGVAPATVRWRLARALDELRARLDGRKGGRDEWLAALAPLAAPRPPSTVRPAASKTAVLSGVLAMTLTTKVLLGAAAAAALLAFLWTSYGSVSVEPRSARTATPGDVERVEASRPGKRDQPARAPRRRTAEESAASATDPAPTADIPWEKDAATVPFEVRARVLDASGAPAAGARVQCGTGGTPPGADGDADGRLAFSVDAGPEVKSLDFVVSAARSATRIVAAAPPRSGAVLDLGDVRLVPGGAVSGLVTDADGPIAGAKVGVATTGAELAQVLDVAPVTETNADGRFTLGGVPTGSPRISVTKTGYDWSSQSVEVNAGEEHYGLAFVLRRRDPALMVQGVVQTPDGAPAPAAVVTYRYEGHGSSGQGTVTSDERGRFEIEGGRDKTWRISARDASGDWSSSAATEAVSGAADVVLRLTDTRWVEVAVTRDGVPVERFALEIRSAVARAPGEPEISLERLGEEVRAAGVARVRLPAQRFSVVVTAPGCSIATVGPLDPSKTGQRIDLRVAALPGLSGVVTAAGAPVAKVRVTLRAVVAPGMREIRNGFPCLTSEAWEAGVVETAADGTFDVTVRTPGRFVLRAEAPDLAPAEAGPFDVVPEVGRAGIVMALTKGGAIEGRVLVREGRTAEGVIVGISRGDGEARTLRAGPEGEFRFEHLTPGPWLVRQNEREIRAGLSTVMSTTGEARFEWSCDVADGVATHFNLDLRVESKIAVRGDVRVDGSPAGGWKVALFEGSSILTAEETTSGTVAESGGYRLGAPRAGDYFVRVTSPRGLYVFAPVELADAEAPLGIEFLTGTVSVRGAEPGQSLALIGELPEGRCALAEAATDAKGASGPTQFPAGRVRLVRPKEGEPEPRAWPTVAEGVLAAGSTLTLDAPVK